MYDIENNDGVTPLCHNLLTGGAVVRQVITNVNCPACLDLFERHGRHQDELYSWGRNDAEQMSENAAEAALIHNTAGRIGERLRGFRDVVNERRVARGLGDYLYSE
jgi:hypothetical protein